MDKSLFGWVSAIARTKEPELVEKLGLDAALFLRFTRMLRSIFTCLTIAGIGIILPLNLFSSRKFSGQTWLARLTPMYMFGSSLFWAYVVIAYLFDAIICYFLWHNYKAVLRLRRAYFDSEDYQRSLHARTLLLTDIPQNLRSDEGIITIAEEIGGSAHTPKPAIARNVKDLPELMGEHEETVKSLEKHLAKYLKNPDKLPSARPTCKANKNDRAYSKGQKVDAIDYLTKRIKELEADIKEVRRTVDKRSAMSYGFASYPSISEAHVIASKAKKPGPQGTMIRLAAKSRDLIWKNLKMSKQQRRRQNIVNNLWVALLTVMWVIPNILMAVFLSNLSNLGLVWPAFQKSLYAHKTFWSIVQGVAAPAITTLFYFYLPAIFRRLLTNAGDLSRTSRERHVMHKLFFFFIFNNFFIFSGLSTAVTLGARIFSPSGKDQTVWDAIKAAGPVRSVLQGLVSVSPYWCSWLLQRNLGAAIDLGQLVRLTWGAAQRRWLNPTPRELIELTAPQPFEYASYYNYFLFYMAVALCFGALQPLALAITCLYFWLDSFAKKYMLLYIFITKYESGGMFWRTLFNRTLICALLGNGVIALLIIAQAVSGDNGAFYNVGMLGALVPLPFLLAAFKWYCRRTFDDQIHYSSTRQTANDDEHASSDRKHRRGHRVATRFGHPALQKPMITPMVSAKSQHLLKQVYSGRLSLDETRGLGGFSDVYMENMDEHRPGKSASTAPFEFVNENEMDFEHFKNRPDFRDSYGGTGELFGNSQDMSRPTTPGSMMTGHRRTGTLESGYSSGDNRRSRAFLAHSRNHSRSMSRDLGSDTGGMEYPRGYHAAPSGLRDHSPGSDWDATAISRTQSHEHLTARPARMGRAGSHNGGTPEPYGLVSYEGTPLDDDPSLSYDYFRRNGR